MSKLIRKLNSLLSSKKHSWYINMVMGGCLFATGDAIEQSIEIRRKRIPKYDWKRTGRMMTIGILTGSVNQVFFSRLEKRFPGNDMKTIWKKVFLDQLFSCPVFNLQFFLGMSLMEGKSFRDGWEEFLRKFPTVFVIDLILWTPCQLITFLYIPLSHRVFFVNSVTVFWNIFLSYYKHYDQNEDPRIAECCRKGTCTCHKNESPLKSMIMQVFQK